MRSPESLKGFGTDAEEGLGRAFNDKGFWLRPAGMALAEPSFDRV